MVAQPLRGVVGVVRDVWSRYGVPLAEVVGLYSLGRLLYEKMVIRGPVACVVCVAGLLLLIM